jgi:hypothetical protein
MKLGGLISIAFVFVTPQQRRFGSAQSRVVPHQVLMAQTLRLPLYWKKTLGCGARLR